LTKKRKAQNSQLKNCVTSILHQESQIEHNEKLVKNKKDESFLKLSGLSSAKKTKFENVININSGKNVLLLISCGGKIIKKNVFSP
jgi:hypothetical protein